jgi:hypothetical protein
MNFNKEIITNWTADHFKMFEGRKYSIEELKFITENAQVSLKSILMTQKLDKEYCKKYLLDSNNKYSIKEADKNITIDDILYYQKHLKYNDFS